MFEGSEEGEEGDENVVPGVPPGRRPDRRRMGFFVDTDAAGAPCWSCVEGGRLAVWGGDGWLTPCKVIYFSAQTQTTTTKSVGAGQEYIYWYEWGLPYEFWDDGPEWGQSALPEWVQSTLPE